MLDSFSNETIAMLASIIEAFLSLCSEHNNELKITVKFHHLIHYPSMIAKFGPPKILSTINFESLHSYLKSKIKNSKTWKFACYTIAAKYAQCRISEDKSAIS